MLNSADRKAILRTFIIFAAALLFIQFGFDYIHKVPWLASKPELFAILSLVMLVVISELGIPMEICFLICGIAGCFIMKIPLYDYGAEIRKSALSESNLIIILSGAVVALLLRGDLMDGFSRINPDKDKELYSDLNQQISVFCLLKKLQEYIIKVNRKNKMIAAIIFLFQSMLLFVSSIVSISTMSAMMKGSSKKRTHEENVYTNAGLLCMCVSGCLLVFFVMKSPWWLFFIESAKGNGITVKWPIATLIYAVFSFIHGYWLLSKSRALSSDEEEDAEEKNSHPLMKRHFIIFVGIIVIFLGITIPNIVSSIQENKNPQTTVSTQTTQTVQTAKAAQAASPVQTNTPVESSKDLINHSIISILILLISAIIFATVITRKIMSQSNAVSPRNNITGELKKLILGDLKSDSGIKSVIGLLVLIVSITSFDEIIKEGIKHDKVSTSYSLSSGFQLFSQDGAVFFTLCVLILIVVYFIGKVLGSNFGTFSIGLIILSIFSSKFTGLNNELLQRWMFESFIIVSTFCNQVSPDSSNASALAAGTQMTSKQIQKQAWAAESFFKLSALRVQMIAMIACVIISALLTHFGIDI